MISMSASCVHYIPSCFFGLNGFRQLLDQLLFSITLGSQCTGYALGAPKKGARSTRRFQEPLVKLEVSVLCSLDLLGHCEENTWMAMGFNMF